jgi:nitrite reductase/ring-hydroxylating ferredoxin subunit
VGTEIRTRLESRQPQATAIEVEDGCVRCPWHGYRFDLRTGLSADGRGLRLAPAPEVRVDPGTGAVRLCWNARI